MFLLFLLSAAANALSESGFVLTNVSTENYLFYYLAYSKGNVSHDPLILWLNGGPGASSIENGLLFENGPFFIDDSLNIVANKNSWNEAANGKCCSEFCFVFVVCCK